MNFSTKLSTLLDVRPGEGTIVLLVLLYTILSYSANVLAQTTAFSLFLSAFDALYLPYIYIGVSVSVTLFSIIYLKLDERIALGKLLIVNLSFLLITLIGLRLALGVTVGWWLIFGLPIWHGVFDTLMYVAFWNLLGRLFNLQQGKRLFGLLSAGRHIATISMGFLVPTLVILIGVRNLLWISALVGASALGVLIVITRLPSASALSTPGQMASEESASTTQELVGVQPHQEPQPVVNHLLADPYVRLMFIMFVLFALGVYFVDNIFYVQVKTQFRNTNQLASFIGVFHGVASGLSLLIQIFISGRLYRRYGLRFIILLTPLMLAISTALFALVGTFFNLSLVLVGLAILTNLVRRVLDEFDNTAANILYQPLPAQQRTRTQTTLDGIVSPAAVGLTGLVLLVLTNVLDYDSVQLSYILLIILICWIITVIALGHAYGNRVQQALRQRIIQGNGEFQPDQTSLQIIQQRLAAPHPGTVIYALDLLEASDAAAAARVLPDVLTHTNPLVRLDALARMERLGNASAISAIKRCVHADPSSVVRGAALRTLASLGGLETFDEVYAYLASDEPQLRQNVMVGLLRSGELEGILAVGETLAQCINSSSPPDRIFAAEVLGESGVASFYRPLLRLLRDKEPMVQCAALVAAGKLKQAKLWPVVVEHLASPRVRATAVNALVAGDEATVPALKAAFEQHNENPEALIRLARVCGRIRGPQVMALLRNHLDFPNVRVRTQILHALHHCGYQAATEQRAVIETEIQCEIANAAQMLATLVDLGEGESLALLRAALDDALAQQQARLLHWLSFISDPRMITQAQDALGIEQRFMHAYLSPSSAEQRGYALEILDVLLPKETGKYIVPLVDNLDPAQKLRQLVTDFPQSTRRWPQRLQELITASDGWIDPWTKAMAVHTAILAVNTDDSRDGLVDSIALARTSPNWLVRETATQMTAHRTVIHTEKPMLLTIEKVMILKAVEIFADTPHEILVDIAALLKEIAAPADTTIFEKGTRGDSMYIIVEGEVTIRDGVQILDRLGEREVFGEMALLDAEPRTATVYTSQATRLLRLDQEPFYELMDDRIEIARGVIHVLLQRLRARMVDVNALQAQLDASANQ